MIPRAQFPRADWEVVKVSKGEYPPHLVKKEGEPAYKTVLRKMWKRVHFKGGNWICSAVGGVRSGKTTFCLGCGDELGWKKFRNKKTGEIVWGKDFTVEKNVLATGKELMDAMSNDEEIGSFYVWEEAAALNKGANARRFYEDINQRIASFFMVMGHKRQFVFMNQPFANMVDKYLRQLSHSQFFADRYSVKYKGVIGRFTFVKPTSKDPLSIYPRILGQYSAVRLRRMIFPGPSIITRVHYKKFEAAFKKKWEEEYATFEKPEDSKEVVVANEDSYLKEIHENFESLQKKGKLSISLVSRLLGVNREKANRLTGVYERKLKNNEVFFKT